MLDSDRKDNFIKSVNYNHVFYLYCAELCFYIFFKKILKYLKYTYYNIYYNNNFLKINF